MRRSRTPALSASLGVAPKTLIRPASGSASEQRNVSNNRASPVSGLTAWKVE